MLILFLSLIFPQVIESDLVVQVALIAENRRYAGMSYKMFGSVQNLYPAKN